MMDSELVKSLKTDQTSREAIINDLNHNLIVEAGAGSGKTYSLVRRLVSMVEHNIDISTVSCITFTRAAASEFYQRFQNLLSVRSNLDAPVDKDLGPVTAQSAMLCASALKDIDLCFMGTIDSFIQKLINEHPYDFKVPANVEVVDKNVFDNIISSQCLLLLQGKFDDVDPGLSSEVVDVLPYIGGVHNFIYGVQQLYPHYHQEIICPNKVSIPSIDVKYQTEKQKLINGIKEIEVFIEELLEKKLIDKVSEKTRAAIQNAGYISFSWDKYLSNVIASIKKICEIKIKCPKDPNYSLPQILVKAKNSYVVDETYSVILLNELEEIRYSYAMNVIIRAIKVLSPYFKQKGIATYTDFIINLRDALKEDAKNGGKIIKYVQKKRQRYLLDEFQDTNPLQTEIFFYLTATKPNEDYRKCLPLPGSLFIVGDPKQSIYRFNGADIEAFLDVEKLIEADPNGKILFLTQNFRSNNALKNYFNVTMEDTLKVAEGNQDTHYKPIPITTGITKETLPTLDGVFYYRFDASGGNSDGYTPLINLIKTIVNNDKYTISIKGQVRKINYQDIMVIFDEKNAIGKVIPYFFNNNIPFVTEGALAFESSSALEEIKILFNLLCKPDNQEFIYQALLTPYAGLNENDAISLINISGTINISDNQEYDVPKYINEGINKLVNLYLACKDLSYSAKFLYLVENTSLYLRHDTKFMEYVYYAYEVLKTQFNNHLIISADDAINLVASFTSGNKDFERCLSLSPNGLEISNTGGKVKIANLHKTKGLEAPVVILAALNAPRSYPPKCRVERNKDGTKCYVFEIVGDFKKQVCKTDRFDNSMDEVNGDKFHQENIALEEERRRVLYVGATRSIASLFIAKAYKYNDGKQVDASCCWDALFQADSNIPEFNIGDTFGESFSINETKKKPSTIYEKEIQDLDKTASFNLKRPSKLKIQPASEEEDKTDGITYISESWLLSNATYFKQNHAKEDAAIIGTLVHRLMQLLVNSSNSYSKHDLVNKILSEYLRLEKEYHDILEEVYEHITNGGYPQKEAVPNDILKTLLSAKKVLTEVPFSYKNGNDLYHGVMDVIYLDQNDKWHIIDYKTNKEENIEKLEDEYAAQLLSYKEAFKHITNEEADAHIYHIVC